MPVDPATAAAAAYVPAPANPNGAIDKDGFLKLLVAELKAQDPMDPMDAREMVAQLSQLSTVEKLSGIDKSLTELRAETAGMASTQISSLVGRTVSADSTRMLLGTDQAAAGNFTLDGQADSVNLEIRDAQGTHVRTLNLGERYPGMQPFEWDGMDDQGTRAPAGSYTFEIAARNAGGQIVTASTRVSGVVTQVSYESGAPELIVGESRILLGDVTSIAQ